MEGATKMLATTSYNVSKHVMFINIDKQGLVNLVNVLIFHIQLLI